MTHYSQAATVVTITSKVNGKTGILIPCRSEPPPPRIKHGSDDPLRRYHRSKFSKREVGRSVVNAYSLIIGKLLYAVSSWWGFASAADRERLQALLYNVASVVAYAPQKHLTSQNWQNLLMTHYSNASCTTRTVSCTTSSMNGANLYITSDQDIRIGN